MNEHIINEQYDHIIDSLDRRCLIDAFGMINTFTENINDWKIRSNLEELYTSYEYMLKYMMEGAADPSRAKLYAKMVASLYTLVDRAYIMLRMPTSTEYYFDRLRFYSHIPVKSMSTLQIEIESYAEELILKRLINGKENDIESRTLAKNLENTSTELFYRVWVSDRWTEEEEQQAKDLLDSRSIPLNTLSLFVSAVTLSLTVYFDVRKLTFLLDAYRHTSNQINQRAIVGILIAIYLHDLRLSLYPEVVSRIKLLNDDQDFVTNLQTVQIQFLRSRETEKIDKKMREEIIPEMVKNISRMTKIEMEDAEDENVSEDKNPDWEDLTETSGLQDRLKEMSELQMEGADVYMSTFSQLKRYPFFTEMANWFYPFDKQHSHIVQVFEEEAGKQILLLDNLLQSAFFCNSDKYSFCFTIMQIPEAQRSMMVRQLEEQNAGMNDDTARSDIQLFAHRSENISNQYIQDLYRFYKIFPRRHEFWSPFSAGVDVYYSEVLKDITHRPDFMRAQANFLFKKEYFVEACSIYQDLEKIYGGNAELYQKMGLCLQKNKYYSAAIAAYLNADLEHPDNEWTNHHLAMCYKFIGQYDKALEYYQKVEMVRPENLKVVTQTGLCLANLKRYDEALKYFFKVEYLNGGTIKIWQAIGWSSFLVGKQEQAMKYYDRIVEKKEVQSLDYLNAGHVAWVLGNAEKAANMYIACRTMLPDHEQFLTLFNQDKELIIKKGVDPQEIPLMCDLILYLSQNK